MTTPLTIEQFREQYGDSDRVEFWDGDVVEKALLSSASLLPVDEWLLPNHRALLMTELWSKVDAEKDRLRPRP